MAHVYQFFEETEHTESLIVTSYKKHNESSSKIQWAAIIIQSFFRGILVRQQMKVLQRAAVTIQRYVRGWLTRYRLPDVMHEYYDTMCLNHYNRAAAKIQAGWRGYIVRTYDVCLSDILQMKEQASNANENIKKLFQQRFSNMGLDSFQKNTKLSKKLFNILLDRHHLLRTNQISGILSRQDTKELSELELLIKSVPWKDYMNQIHKMFYEYHNEIPQIKYKYQDKKLRKLEDILRNSKKIEDEYKSNKEQIDATSSKVLKEKGFILDKKIERKPYERYISTTGKYVKPIKNIVRSVNPRKNISKTDFNLGVRKDLDLKAKKSPYIINYWYEKCPCEDENF